MYRPTDGIIKIFVYALLLNLQFTYLLTHLLTYTSKRRSRILRGCQVERKILSDFPTF